MSVRGEGREPASVIRHLDATGSAELAGSPVAGLIRQVASLPDIRRIDVYPDITRKTWGFPAGITTTAQGTDPIVYPMAVPDIACGFLVAATGITAAALPRGRRGACLRAITEAVGVASAFRRRLGLDLDAVFVSGASALPPGEFDPGEYGTGLSERDDACAPRPDLVTTATRRALADQAGSAAGHFISLYSAEPLTSDGPVEADELVLIVHTGAPVLRDEMMASHAVQIAEECVRRELLSLNLIEQGLFGLPLSHALSQEYLGLTACAANWGYANRRIVADRLLSLLEDQVTTPGSRQPRLLRHVSHCSLRVRLSPVEAEIATARGIQPLTAERAKQPVPAPATFVTGGSHTHAYLVVPGPRAAEHGSACPHGTPQWEPARVPSNLAASPLIDPAISRTGQVAANTSPDAAYQRRHLINIETTITALTELGIAIPVARLKPLINYREPRYD